MSKEVNKLPPNCLPFVLKKALKGKPVRTRYGNEVVNFHYDDTDEIYPLKGTLLDLGLQFSWMRDGVFMANSETHLDLFMLDTNQ